MKKPTRRDKLRKKILKDHIEIRFTTCPDCGIYDKCLTFNTYDPCRAKTMFKKRPEFHYTVTERWFLGKSGIHKRYTVKDNYKDEIICDIKDSPYSWWINSVNDFIDKKLITEYNSECIVQRVRRLKDL